MHCTIETIKGDCKQGVKFDLTLPPAQKLITQPPADTVLGDAAMFHYTWGTIWKDAAGQVIWKWDKREYTDAKLELEVRPCIIEHWHLWRAAELRQTSQDH